ncbi:MAG: hypothetical protein H8K07_13205 [Nitrospira sp.]|nr:hypothetical protein [Nitrospira sp.]
MSLIEATTVKLFDSESKIETILKLKKEESSHSENLDRQRDYLLPLPQPVGIHHSSRQRNLRSIDGPRSFR